MAVFLVVGVSKHQALHTGLNTSDCLRGVNESHCSGEREKGKEIGGVFTD